MGDISKTTKGAPSFSMGGRTKDLASSNAPGPGAYNSEDAARYKKAPAFSMSGRAKEDAARLGPGPGAYTTPDALSKLSALVLDGWSYQGSCKQQRARTGTVLCSRC